MRIEVRRPLDEHMREALARLRAAERRAIEGDPIPPDEALGEIAALRGLSTGKLRTAVKRLERMKTARRARAAVEAARARRTIKAAKRAADMRAAVAAFEREFGNGLV